MKPHLLADENTSHRLVSACSRIHSAFPIIHIAEWQNGAYRSIKDPALREHHMVLVTFDRAGIVMHAGTLTREGVGHAGVIIFRRSIAAGAYGKQARFLVEFWNQAKRWDWSDRVAYLPRRLGGRGTERVGRMIGG